MNDIEKSKLPTPLDQLPPEVIQKLEEHGIISQTLEVQHYSSRPIPSPAELEQYENINEGFAHRIISMAEREQNHRHMIEETGVNAAVAAEKRGQTYVLIISAFVIGGLVGLGYLGHPVWGLTFALPALAGLAYPLITGSRQKKRDNGKES